MKEELNFHGNELVQLQTMYTVGAVVGMVPFLFLFTYIPMHWTIPAMDILWGVFTLLQYRANSFTKMAVYRFMVGFFEVSSERNHSLPFRGLQTNWYCRLRSSQLCTSFSVSVRTRKT
jgi:hypothetical protein